MRHNIMDYSLLVGVHKLTEEEKEYKNRKLNALNQKSEITITVNDSSAETTPSSSVASEISTKSKAKREKSDNSLNIVVSTSPRGKKSKKGSSPIFSLPFFPFLPPLPFAFLSFYLI